LDGRLIVGGMAHDFDYARLELLKLLGEHQHLRVGVSDSFEDIDKLDACRFLITYTCNLQPSDQAARALRRFVERGGRWFALHATNSLLAWTDKGVAPRLEAEDFIETLGSQFLAHPPIGPFLVRNVAPDHPLTENISEFETTDELYLSALRPGLQVLLETRFNGEAPGFTAADWTDDAPRPVLYLRPLGKGTVLYCTLGHCRGHFDAPHRTPYFPEVERGSWATPAFTTILRRGIAWAAQLSPFEQSKDQDHGR
jgi:type 1 glutamine amidotransferase